MKATKMRSHEMIPCVALALLLAVVSGCGGAHPPAAEHASTAAPADDSAKAGDAAPTVAGDDEDALQLGQLPQPDGRRKPATLEEAQQAFDNDLSQLDTLLADRTTALSSGAAGCTRACNAFNSLKRSADALCELAGSDDARCGAARSKVSDNQARIAEAGCGCH